MNGDEVYEIKKTWEIPMQDAAESGVTILHRFLTKYPSNMEKFPTFQGIPTTDLKENIRFRTHSMRIMRVFDESINCLGFDWCGQKLEEIWSKIATTHFQRQIEKRAFNELKEVILEILSAACNLNEKQTAAWVKLMDSVYHIVFTTLDKLEKDAQ